MKYKVMELTEKGQFGEVKDRKFFDNSTFSDLDRAHDLRNYLGGTHVVTFETHRGYRIILNDSNPSSVYGIIITANQDTDTEHYIAYSYMGDGYNKTYINSRSYKTFKGASKKVREYLNY